MSKREFKITGWAYSGYVEGQQALVVVPGPTHQDAVEQCRRALMTTDPSQIRPVTLLPGHDHYPWREEYDWTAEPACKPVEEEP